MNAKNNLALKAVLLFIQSRGHLLSRYGELVEITSKEFEEKSERLTNELKGDCIRLQKRGIPLRKN